MPLSKRGKDYIAKALGCLARCNARRNIWRKLSDEIGPPADTALTVCCAF